MLCFKKPSVSYLPRRVHVHNFVHVSAGFLCAVVHIVGSVSIVLGKSSICVIEQPLFESWWWEDDMNGFTDAAL